ncbi:MAG: succinylglutamate desuccinylase/aspartoacylase family protein, partial [Limnochordia bacterium]
MNTQSKYRSQCHRSILIAIVALTVTLIGLASQTIGASPVEMGWSSFITGPWEPEVAWPPEDSEVLGAGLVKGVLAKGTKHETPYYIYNSGVKGPTVVVIGGMHGNEKAGYMAAREIKDFTVKKGRLIVIPELNRPAVKAAKRTSSLGDMNRAFPRKKTDSPRNYLAKDIWNLMVKYRPTWLVDLHEG